ncbi:Kef-type K+ transport systems, membrane component [Archaeoglobus sulfaticallidus PM70-1]|uniref:Kef-type K+ transport systems, membrane component n=1 Tax=Archaeoglobus sulfaticallidus PM70-1 TaxID=387631 RepID=N0BKE5_9EURY|nr:cation:proton antiporter [Archaeoglobus sulfaticallidus]AGK60645.1 Kef-type K+ transport systems, membrane component [Archaeoglobus sulfaticallidus PM70-1]
MTGESEVSALLFKLAIILISAKIFGEIVENRFKQPAVLGELLAGMVIGPFALGPYIGIHPVPGAPLPIPPDVDMIANISVILLLFVAGLETDIEKFLRFGLISGLVGAMGIVLPFFLGFLAIELFYDAPNKFAAGLFTGAALTATSVGITARVLNDLGKLTTPEGSTILGAAVIDDVLGILVLAIVVAITGVEGEAMSTFEIAKTIVIAVVFWIGVIFLGLKFVDQISRILSMFKMPGSQLTVAIAFGLMISYLASLVKLAPIIGAYAAGLALSASAHRDFLAERMIPIYEFLVPIFFVAMGMLVDVKRIPEIALLGVVIIVFAIIGKFFGCYVAAYFGGFNKHGASRIGIGMVPRGEVGLIVAYYGLKYGVIDEHIYTIAVVMSFVTTMITPPLLKKTFENPVEGWVEKRKSSA